MSNNNNKKALAEKIKKELNSPEYVAVPDLISGDSNHGYFLALDSKDKDGRIWSMTKGGWKTKVKESQLGPKDWEEIINLIEKRNQEKEQNWQAKRKKIEEKLNSRSDLYYYWGKSEHELRKNGRADGWHPDKDMRGYTSFLGGNGNGLTHHLYITEEHLVLDNFSFQTGFYLIDNNQKVKKCVGHYEGGFGCSGGETNPSNWEKFVEVGDKIIITPVETVDKPIEKPSQRENPSENNQIAGGENNNRNKPTKKLSEADKEITEWLIQYFQEKDIKEVVAKPDGSLNITHNNNETATTEQITNNRELQNVKNFSAKNDDKTLKLEELQKLLDEFNKPQNSAPSSPKTNYTPYLVGGAFVMLSALLVAGYYLRKNWNKKSKK